MCSNNNFNSLKQYHACQIITRYSLVVSGFCGSMDWNLHWFLRFLFHACHKGR